MKGCMTEINKVKVADFETLSHETVGKYRHM
jgi:hypothetical protein